MRRSGSGKVVIEPKETSYSSKRDLIYAQKRPQVVIVLLMEQRATARLASWDANLQMEKR